MKIAQIIKHYYPYKGGVETYAREIVLGLRDRKDVELSILTTNDRARTLCGRIDGAGITRLASFGELFSVPLCPTFPFWLKRQTADILHFQMPFPLAEFSELFTPKRSKIVASWHSDIVKQELQRKIFEPFLLRFLDRVDKILVATPNHITSSLYLPRYRDKCKVVPYGIDLSRFGMINPDDPQVKSIKNKYPGPLVLFVGRLVYYKGLEYLIAAMKDIDAHLLIIGNGPLKDKLSQQIINSGLQDKVTMLDSIGDDVLPYYYHASDIFVLPSIANSEAFGIVMAEAMACGKPVVSSNLPTGVTYVNQDKVTGLTVPVKDPAALASAVNKLLRDPTGRKKMGENARERVSREFDNKALGEKIYSVYRELLK